MCGIAGSLEAVEHMNGERLTENAHRMACALAHRGPDESGVWTDPDVGVAFGFRRLAIIDLTEAGHQPMCSPDGRYVLIFNGEVYNHQDLRAELQAAGECAFRGRSDTETLLRAIARWGIESAVQRAVGMFAFAVWDRHERSLTLGRDRLGEKPLYYGWLGSTFAFGSELKALRAHPSFSNHIDRDALSLLLRLKYIPAPYSIYQHIRKLMPGTLLTIGRDDLWVRKFPRPRPYWNMLEVAERGASHRFPGTRDEAIEELLRLLRTSIRGQMLADVPLGAFLSGGVDSSTVVAVMQELSTQPVRTFTIGFEREAFNEAPYAKRVAEHLGTSHTERRLTADDAMATIPSLAWRYDEPFGDSSQIPMVLVSDVARGHVTVALSGDGGDELFAGYNRYHSGFAAWSRLMRVPASVRGPVARSLMSLPPGLVQGVEASAARVLPQRLRIHGWSEKTRKLGRALVAGDQGLPAYYQSLVSDWDEPARVVTGSSEPVTEWDDAGLWDTFVDPREAMMAFDMVSYLPGDILTKVDRAGMSVSLETRMPFLDHRLVEFAWTLPLGMKLDRHGGKRILRELLYERVPRDLIERPKAGFGIPLHEWLRGPLKSWADDLLCEGRLRDDGYFEPTLVRNLWKEHRSKAHDWHHHIWTVLMFQEWLRAQ